MFDNYSSRVLEVLVVCFIQFQNFSFLFPAWSSTLSTPKFTVEVLLISSPLTQSLVSDRSEEKVITDKEKIKLL